MKKSVVMFASLVWVILCCVTFQIKAEAASYPSILLMTPEFDIMEGESTELDFMIIPEFKNEKYYVMIYNSSGDCVASASDTYYNSSPMIFHQIIRLDVGELNLKPGKYTIEYWLEFYSLYEWHEVPNHHKAFFTVVKDVCKGNHTYELKSVTKEPTCDEDGEGKYTCSKCGISTTLAIPKAHTWGNYSSSDENNHEYTCTICGVSEKSNHVWNDGEVTKKPTCKDEGEMTYTCTACGGTKTEPVAKATDHTYGDWVCDGDQHKHACTIENTAHSWNSGEVTKKPTCKDEGEMTYTCTACGGTKTEPVAKATDHAYGDWVCDGDQHKHTCTICGNEENTAHSWNSGEVTKKPTCREGGAKTYTCTTCGDTKAEEIAATGHTEVVDKGKAPTCTETGLTEGKHCYVCNEVLIQPEIVASKGHGKTELRNVMAATKKTNGYTGDTYCTVCSQKLADGDVIPATGDNTVIVIVAVVAIAAVGGGVALVLIKKKK